MDSREAVLAYWLGLGLAVVICVFGAMHPEWWEKGGLADRFQTLIGAVTAVIAAFIGGAFIYGQTRSAERRALREDERRQIASRARLPHLLDEVIVYCRRAMAVLSDLENSTSSMVLSPVLGLAWPTLSYSVVDRLALSLESAGEASEGAIHATLIDLQLLAVNLQHHRERLASPRGTGHIVTRLDNHHLAVRAAGVFLEASSLYEYGRRASNEPPAPVTVGQAVDAMSVLLRYSGEWKNDFERVWKTPERAGQPFNRWRR